MLCGPFTTNSDFFLVWAPTATAEHAATLCSNQEWRMSKLQMDKSPINSGEKAGPTQEMAEGWVGVSVRSTQRERPVPSGQCTKFSKTRVVDGHRCNNMY